MAKVTSSSDRSKRKTKKPVSTDKGRQARARVSTARVTSASNGRGAGSGSARVTTGQGGAKPARPALPASKPARAALPPGRQGGALAQRASSPRPALPPAGGTGRRPATPRRTAAETKLQQAAQGTRSNVLRSRGPAAAPPKPSATARTSQTVRNTASRLADRAGAQMGPTGRNLVRSLSKGAGKGPVGYIVSAAADAALKPLAEKAGRSLGKALTPVGRAIDNARPGVNSKDEAQRRKSQMQAKGSTSKFKGAREKAFAKAKAIKGSPVVGTRKASSGGSGAASFDSAFASARSAGKSTFTWRGKKYTTKMK